MMGLADFLFGHGHVIALDDTPEDPSLVKIQPELAVVVDGVGEQRRMMCPARGGGAIFLPIHIGGLGLEQGTGLVQRGLPWNEQVHRGSIEGGPRRGAGSQTDDKDESGQATQPQQPGGHQSCRTVFWNDRTHQRLARLNMLVPWILRKASEAASSADLRNSSWVVAS